MTSEIKIEKITDAATRTHYYDDLDAGWRDMIDGWLTVELADQIVCDDRHYEIREGCDVACECPITDDWMIDGHMPAALFWEHEDEDDDYDGRDLYTYAWRLVNVRRDTLGEYADEGDDLLIAVYRAY